MEFIFHDQSIWNNFGVISISCPPKNFSQYFRKLIFTQTSANNRWYMLQIPGESFWQTAPGWSGKACIPQKFNIDILLKNGHVWKPESPFSKAHHFGISKTVCFQGVFRGFFRQIFWMLRHMVPHPDIPKLMLLSSLRRQPLHPPRGNQQPVTSHGGLDKHTMEKKKVPSWG